MNSSSHSTIFVRDENTAPFTESTLKDSRCHLSLQDAPRFHEHDPANKRRLSNNKVDSSVPEYSFPPQNPQLNKFSSITALSQPDDVLKEPIEIADYNHPQHDAIISHPHLKDATMPSNNRSGGRDVHLFSKQDPNTKVGGLILTAGITNANLHTMVEILVIFHADYTLLGESGTKLEKDDSPLQPGNYYIASSGTL